MMLILNSALWADTPRVSDAIKRCAKERYNGNIVLFKSSYTR